MSRPAIPAEYTKPDFLSPSIVKVTVLPLEDFFVQLSIISSPPSWSLVCCNPRYRARGNCLCSDYSLLPIDSSMCRERLFDSLKDALWGPSSPRGSQR